MKEEDKDEGDNEHKKWIIMTNLFLTNDSLQKFVEKVDIAEDSRKTLISGIPELDEQERTELFQSLKDIYFLGQEEKEAIARIKKFWRE